MVPTHTPKCEDVAGHVGMPPTPRSNLDGGDFVSPLLFRERTETHDLFEPYHFRERPVRLDVVSPLSLSYLVDAWFRGIVCACPGRIVNKWVVGNSKFLVLARRELQSARNPRPRLVEAPNPKPIPSRRSARIGVVKNSPVRAYNDMAAEEESAETKTEEDYIPGKSSNPKQLVCLCSSGWCKCFRVIVGLWMH